MLELIHETRDESPVGVMQLDELAREGARRMLAAALEEEVASYVERHRHERDERGRALVVRNGRARPRCVTIGSGTIPVRAPRVNDKRVDEHGRRRRFRSAILPPYLRRSPEVSRTLPLLYLRGLSTGDFREALPNLLGDASGLSPTSITRLTAAWNEEYQEFRRRDLSDRDYVYVWADGIHVDVRLEREHLCTLVLIGARADGTKEVIAVEEGVREDAASWRAVLRDLRRRGLRAPVLAIGDGALGFWAAVRDTWPETRQQRCWVHRLVNVLDKLPKTLRGRARALLRDMMNAESREACTALKDRFAVEFGNHPRAVASLTRDWEKLTTHFDFPVEHWRHVRTTNVIESAFATLRLRQRVTKGAGSRERGLILTWKLLAMAERKWRRLNAAALQPPECWSAG